MKLISVLLVLFGVALAQNIEQADNAFTHSPTDDIVLTPVASWMLVGAKTPRGIDCSDTVGEIFITDYSMDMIFICDYSGNSLGYIDLPDGLDDVGGIASGSNFLAVNEMNSDTYMFRYQSPNWNNMFMNPSSNPMGLDIDDSGYYWQMENSSNMLYRLDASGNVLNQWTLTELPAQASAMACAVLPINGTNIIMIGGLTWSDFYFYEWTGANLVFIGTHVLPQTCNKSYGAAWCQQRNSVFWVYKTGGDFAVCEFQCFITGVALDRATWGEIKYVF